MFRNFAGRDQVPFEQDTLPWLLTRALPLLIPEQGNQVLVPHDCNASWRSVLFQDARSLHAFIFAGIAYSRARQVRN